MIPSFFRVQTLDVTESTNAVARQAAEAGEAEGLVVQALRQTAGKGRLGRTWESPEGNLYVSVLLRPRRTLQQTALYTFAAALAVHDAVLKACPEASLQLKWPNDVLVEGKKISGVLLETAPVVDNLVEWIVIGVGLNVTHHPDEALYPTTSLSEQGSSVTVEAALAYFLQSLDQWRQTLYYDGFCPIRKAWLSDAKMGAMVVRLPSGEVHGDFAGIDSKGSLILRLADGQETVIRTGDVFFL
ncbi:MAG: biotin--[acetyl-CoA-carboxylase] ligase [Bdellovibrionales bacterium]|jgi:BirA family biotin operon repressor/biotin-[acetyl-CoA-carboxylase] ligase